MTRILTNPEKAIVFTMILSVIFVFSVDDVFAFQQSDTNPSKITTPGDLYVESEEPISVPFSITATDNFNNPILVECDKTLNSIFNTGKTTVRCMAIDSSGDVVKESFVVTVGYKIVQIPDWFKKTTTYWINQTMSDGEYYETLEFLLDEKIIHMPKTEISMDNSHSEIPVWIKTNAEKWVDEKISDDEFSIVLQWILRNSSNQSI